MKHSELGWQSSDGLKVHAQTWSPHCDPAAVVVLIHGMGEHSGRYGPVAEYLADKGIAVFAFDQRGHGKTEGKRGHAPTYDALLDDLEKGIEAAKNHFPGKAIFLYGQSMGGNVVLNYILRRQPQILGAIVSAPWLKLAFKPPTLRLFVSRIMNYIAPRYTETSPLDHADLSRDPEVVRAYGNDPLVHSKITTRFLFGTQDAGIWALENASKLNVPILLMHGTADKITCHSASVQFAARAPKDLVTFHGWDGFFHEIHNEPERAQVLEDVSAFILGSLNQTSKTNSEECQAI